MRPVVDRATVFLLTLATFLVVLALLAVALRRAPVAHATAPAVVVRRIYRTTVVTTIPGPGSASSVSQSVTSSGSGYTGPPAPVTASSH